MLAAAAATETLLQTCAQNCPTAVRTSVLFNSENAFQNEDWPPVFILNLADCLGRLLIMGTNYLVYIISFS
jgi:hypothetical protein